MNIQLVSRDADLHKLCREILHEFSEHDWQLVTDAPGDSASAADFYIWDFQDNGSIPGKLDRSLSSHLFLVHRDELTKLHDCLGRSEANILLKPVTRPTLSAFLGLAVSAHEDRVSNASVLHADRDEMLQCLIQTNLKLQEFDQDRTNFLARALHDFRAPLTALSGYCGLLLNEALGPLNADQREVLRRMQHSTKRLSRMASGMFQLSVGRQVKRRAKLDEGDIRECIEQALHEVGPVVDGKSVSVSVELDPETPVLHFESGLMEQVLINLLDNACKFTPRRGRIEVRGYPFFWERRSSRNPSALTTERRRHNSRRPNVYRIDIFDSGPPIPEEHMESIFEEYTSYSGVHDRSGGGLGLAICRMIISEHDGYVWAENTANGPVFSFVLPVYSEIGLKDPKISSTHAKTTEVCQ